MPVILGTIGYSPMAAPISAIFCETALVGAFGTIPALGSVLTDGGADTDYKYF